MQIGSAATLTVFLNVEGAASHTLHGVYAAIRQKRRRFDGQRAGARAHIPENIVGCETEERQGRGPHGSLGHQASVGHQRVSGQPEMRPPGREVSRQKKQRAGRAEMPPGRLGQRALPAGFVRESEVLENMHAEMNKTAIQQHPRQKGGRCAGVGQYAEGAAAQRGRQKGMQGLPPVQRDGGHVVPRQTKTGAGQLQAGWRGMDAHGLRAPAPHKGRADAEEQRIAVGQNYKRRILTRALLVEKPERCLQRRGKRQQTHLRHKGGHGIKQTPPAANKIGDAQQVQRCGRQSIGRKGRGKAQHMHGSKGSGIHADASSEPSSAKM